MEHKAKEDCYFFLNGSCRQGDNCEFRHVAGVKDALLCTSWLLEKCTDPECPKRHPTLPRQKDGSRTLCYYNKGCTRPDCPFLHEGTITSPATPRPDKESELTITLTPRDLATRDAPFEIDTSTLLNDSGDDTDDNNNNNNNKKDGLLPSPPSRPTNSVAPLQGNARRMPAKGGPLPNLTPRDRQTPLSSLSSSSSSSSSNAVKPSPRSFVKSLDDLLNEKKGADASSSNSNSNSSNSAKTSQGGKPERSQLPQMTSQRTSSSTDNNNNNNNNNSRRQPLLKQQQQQTTSTPTARPSFGVKSLEELIQGQATASAAGAPRGQKAAPSSSSSSSSSSPSSSSSSSGVKRGREESAATAKALPQPQQKQQRAEPAVEEVEEDLEAELADLDADANGADENFDDDELNELLEG